jgi:hypothetical protein
MRKREGGTNTADAPARHAAALFLLFALPMQEMRAIYRRGIIDVPRDSGTPVIPPSPPEPPVARVCAPALTAVRVN